MDMLAAQRQFLRRLYQWSLLEAEMEAKADYPLLRNITNSGVSVFLSLAEALDDNQRHDLSRSLVKNAYFQAPVEAKIHELLQDEFTPEERHLAGEYTKAARLTGLSRRLSAAVREDCAPLHAKSLIRSVTQHLSSMTGSEFVRFEPRIWDNVVNAGDWSILTRLEFTGKAFECSFWLTRCDDSDVVSADGCHQFLRQRMVFDYVRSLGISQTWWIVACEQDVTPCVVAAGSVCKKVMGEIPLLLQGLGVNDE